MYLQRSSFLFKWLYPSCIWQGGQLGTLYLTFDDGPHPEITLFVLEELKKVNAKATFFCIGENVCKYPHVYRKIIDDGHVVGNHTFHHYNGWKTDDAVYLDDIAAAAKWIDSSLFRPPYGKITPFQLKQLAASRFQLKTIMWSLLSRDFDNQISPEQCLKNLQRKVREKDIIVFHDSEKAWERLQFALPPFLQYCMEKGYTFDTFR